jgi:DnaJ homolog subfamily C member 28
MDERDQPAFQEPAKPKRTPVTRQNYHSLIDQRFAQAVADGLFDNLPGRGQPQKLDDDALVAEEDRAAFRLLKANGFALPWIEVRREIDAERAGLDAWRAQINQRWAQLGAAARATAHTQYRRKLDDLQRMIVNYNLTAPRGIAHIEGLRLEDELGKLGTER